ncbi:hypothetical protein LTR36_004296 [Oleoguttula mirabilis]|uniref:Uncharacterized protein n=1 Tax=Oleoguttula mirabilis TaxID=1507867 RepID=A0AAV9JGV3_9PEZI|nr:hypothetical protein LTR36_004296 [Oleoguttula mirabilis]
MGESAQTQSQGHITWTAYHTTTSVHTVPVVKRQTFSSVKSAPMPSVASALTGKRTEKQYLGYTTWTSRWTAQIMSSSLKTVTVVRTRTHTSPPLSVVVTTVTHPVSTAIPSTQATCSCPDAAVSVPIVGASTVPSASAGTPAQSHSQATASPSSAVSQVNSSVGQSVSGTPSSRTYASVSSAALSPYGSVSAGNARTSATDTAVTKQAGSTSVVSQSVNGAATLPTNSQATASSPKATSSSSQVTVKIQSTHSVGTQPTTTKSTASPSAAVYSGAASRKSTMLLSFAAVVVVPAMLL